MAIAGALARALLQLKRYLERAPPRELRLRHHRPPLVFTDGFFEPATESRPARGGVGGVLFDPSDMALLWFSVQLSPD